MSHLLPGQAASNRHGSAVRDQDKSAQIRSGGQKFWQKLVVCAGNSYELDPIEVALASTRWRERTTSGSTTWKASDEPFVARSDSITNGMIGSFEISPGQLRWLEVSGRSLWRTERRAAQAGRRQAGQQSSAMRCGARNRRQNARTTSLYMRRRFVALAAAARRPTRSLSASVTPCAPVA